MDVYTRKYNEKRPLVCMDEVPQTIIGETRVPIAGVKGKAARYDK